MLGKRSISHFEIRTYQFQTRALFVVFTDGTFINFSFMKATKNLFNS